MRELEGERELEGKRERVRGEGETGTMVRRWGRWRAKVGGWVRRARPREADDYLARGLDRHLRGDLAGAIADYERAIAGYPDRQSRAMAYVTRGNAHRDRGDLAAAIADYGQAIACHPGQAAPHLNRAMAYEEAGEGELAMADYRIVRELSADPGWRREAAEGLRRLKGASGSAGDSTTKGTK